MNVFGEDVGNTVGEAFSFMDGNFEWHSFTFNVPNSSSYHDGVNDMAEITKKCVRKVLEDWKVCEGYLPTDRNYEIKNLLE